MSESSGSKHGLRLIGPAMVGVLIMLAVLAGLPNCTDQRTITPTPTTMYYSDVRYIFDATCLKAGCHVGDEPAAELGMASYAEILTGSENGPVIAPGDPEGSLLYRTMAYTSAPEMPVGERLPQRMVDSVGQWIRDGAFESR